MSDINLAQPTGAPKPAGPGLQLPKSPIGGPSGPGGSPMVSPGTGAGMMARAKMRLSGIQKQLVEMASSFGSDVEAFNEVAAAIRSLGRVLNKASGPEAPKSPIPVPPTPPGAGLGGMGAPPTGLPTPAGGAGGTAGGAGPIAPVAD